jgi:MraZ protein
LFAGRFDHALDEKGRTMMPKRFRDRLAITQDRTVWMANALGGTRHLEVRPNSSFQAYFERISKLKPTPQVLDFKRYYFGSALEVEVDAAGRLLVPASLRTRLGLSDKITFVGADEQYFEIWHPEALDQRFAELTGQTGDMLAHLAELGA